MVTSPDELKRAAAARALDYVESGMRLGLGTGSTARYFVELLAVRVHAGLDIVGVPTSSQTEALALKLGITLVEMDATPLDLDLDGADEVETGTLRLIKGLGGEVPAVADTKSPPPALGNPSAPADAPEIIRHRAATR